MYYEIKVNFLKTRVAYGLSYLFATYDIFKWIEKYGEANQSAEERKKEI